MIDDRKEMIEMLKRLDDFGHVMKFSSDGEVVESYQRLSIEVQLLEKMVKAIE